MIKYIDQEDYHLLCSGQIHDPFRVLGMHHIDQDNKKGIFIRAWQPQCDHVSVIYGEKKVEKKMEQPDQNGVFQVEFPRLRKFFPYQLKLKLKDGSTQLLDDPYRFSPVINEYDLYLFNEGNHHHIYRYLGSHVMEVDHVPGVLFAVWAPCAKRVSVVGDFNRWDGRSHQMRIRGSSGIWEIFIPQLGKGNLYKYEIVGADNSLFLKNDPYAYFQEMRPKNASIIYPLSNYQWGDDQYMQKRKEIDPFNQPISIYEVHPGSWKTVPEEGNRPLSYRELADQLIPYVLEMGYTHIELMPIEEHPLDDSWGYQVTGYFSVTSRFGTPDDLRYFLDKCHQNDIGVILDWVPGHFPKDAHALARFDGTALYEHQDPKEGEHPEWGTYIFNYGRNEVKNFLISNAIFWFDEFHFDGLRVDAVASMLYRDYGKKDGEWIPNKYGGNENLEAIEFMKQTNEVVHQYFPGVLMIAEESTSFSGVSRPVYLGGLGYGLKWNMGWMHDSLRYISKDPVYRKFHHNDITFSLMYAFSENFILVISHDEVVHGKGSMINKMPGDVWQKFANLRLYLTYMYTHPGKKLLFMGSEFGQWKEWDFKNSLDWHLLDYTPHKKLQHFLRELNSLYKHNTALWEVDFDYKGFEWIDYYDNESSFLAYIRRGKSFEDIAVVVLNFTPVPRYNYRIGVPIHCFYKELLNSDSSLYWGSNIGNSGGVYSESVAWQGQPFSIQLNIPPLGGIIFKPDLMNISE